MFHETRACGPRSDGKFKITMTEHLKATSFNISLNMKFTFHPKLIIIENTHNLGQRSLNPCALFEKIITTTL
jgi:hypothetical protein